MRSKRERARKGRTARSRDVPTIAFVDRTTGGVDLAGLVRVLQKYVDRHVAPIWGTPARLVAARKPLPGAWTMFFFDHAADARKLGFHKAAYKGFPIGRIFVQSVIENGEPLSLVTSHELAEMLVDPADNLWAARRPRVLYAYEVCDPVEESFFEIDRVPVSNFVYPSYFHAHLKPNSTAFDHLDEVSRPFEILSGGYLQICTGHTIRKKFGSAAKKRRFGQEDRRLHRSEHREEGIRSSRRK